MEEKQRICPGCGAVMTQISKGSMEIDVCPSCSGAFFDFEEMYNSLEHIDTTADTTKEVIEGDDKRDHEGKNLICAACQTRMTEKEYVYDSGVYINFCNGCYSIYLDKGELNEIKNYVISLDESAEGKDMVIKGEKYIKEVNKQSEENYMKIRKQLDDMYWTDDILGLDKVVDFVFRKFF